MGSNLIVEWIFFKNRHICIFVLFRIEYIIDILYLSKDKEDIIMENLDKVYAKRIAEEYAPKTATKVVRLKKLDQKVKRPANIFAFTFGTICALIAGTGMSMIMTDFGPTGTLGLVIGVILGVVGFIGCGINYLAYLKILKSRKEKYAFEITELAKEISEE